MAHGIGTTKGGRNTKLHAVCDDKGRPHVLLLTPGNTHDAKVAMLAINAVPPSQYLVADKAGVPAQLREYRTKPEIAIEEIDRVIAAGVRFGCVLADAGYGLSAPFRQALSARSLCWAVGIPRHQKVYPADVQLTFPVTGCGRKRGLKTADL